MWSMVAQRLTQITPPAATPDQLWQRVEAAWSAVPQEHIQSLFESMPRRVAAPSSRKFSREVGRRGVLPQNWGGIEQNRTVTCVVLKATGNDRRTSSPCRDEFRGPCSDVTVDQVA
ncbi:transposable element Tcb1 transposase [Trichonephila clavipes]|nr:transposable element Tcb1 transposase [Trichonephila clavipes]